MGGMVPLGDASRRPARVPVVTAGIIVVNVVVFVLELMRGDAFVTQWSAVPAQIVSGHHWITILTAMFMHGSWSHIIGNMIFLWAFAPEIEDAMGRGRYLVFYLVGRTLLFIFVFARIRFIPAALLIGLWFISQLFHAGAVAHVQSGGVAYLAHIGGFI